MKKIWSDLNISYNGSQLRSLFCYLQNGVLGDSILSWVGPCNVSLDHMVDGEDVLAGAEIKADNMLHFIIEKFDVQLFSAVCLQRLFAENLVSYIQAKSKIKEISHHLVRSGDDIYFKNKKLNISIATQSPSSSLIHFAINVDGLGAPVPTLSLQELELNPKSTANDMMSIFCDEVDSMIRATQKVKWVR